MLLCLRPPMTRHIWVKLVPSKAPQGLLVISLVLARTEHGAGRERKCSFHVAEEKSKAQRNQDTSLMSHSSRAKENILLA